MVGWCSVVVYMLVVFAFGFGYLRIDCIGWLLLLGLECGCNCCGACVVGLLVSVPGCELVGC